MNCNSGSRFKLLPKSSQLFLWPHNFTKSVNFEKHMYLLANRLRNWEEDTWNILCSIKFIRVWKCFLNWYIFLLTMICSTKLITLHNLWFWFSCSPWTIFWWREGLLLLFLNKEIFSRASGWFVSPMLVCSLLTLTFKRIASTSDVRESWLGC